MKTGLSNTSTSVTYVSIVNGKFAVQCLPESEGATEFKNKEGVIKHYHFYNNLVGYLREITFKPAPDTHPEYKGNWVLSFEADEMFKLNIPKSSGYANAFFCILPNIKASELCSIQAQISVSVWEGKQREQRTIFVKQNGNVLKWAFTKANKNGLPDIETVTLKDGSKVYDDTDRNIFFQKLADDFNGESPKSEVTNTDDEFPF